MNKNNSLKKRIHLTEEQFNRLIYKTILNEYLDNNMVKVKNDIKQSKNSSFGDNWAHEPYGEDKREIIHNEWMIHFADIQTSQKIALDGFKYGNSYDDEKQAVTYQRSKVGGGFNYAYLAKDVLESFNTNTDVEINDLHSSFMYYLAEEEQNSFVMFKGNGFRFFHDGDFENQVVFNSIDQSSKVYIARLYNNYCILTSNKPIMKKKTRVLQKGEGGLNINTKYSYAENPKNYIDNVIYFSANIEKVIKWVMLNFGQYKNSITK